MAKELKDMTNEELWELFPIIISEHNPRWKEYYKSEEVTIEDAIGSDNILRISHYGSTAIPNLMAKPTIDILVEIRDNTDLVKLISDMKSVGYIFSPQKNNPAPHMMFMKGYTPEGFQGQAYHVHIRFNGDWDELYFRDYLLSHPTISQEYGKLKLELMKNYKHDRDGYTYAKSDFIKSVTEKARKEMQGKYVPIIKTSL